MAECSSSSSCSSFEVSEAAFCEVWLEPLIEKVAPALRATFQIKEADLGALRRNEPECLACCALQIAGDESSLDFASRSFEETTGYTAGRCLGTNLEFLELADKDLNDIINGRELQLVHQFAQPVHSVEQGDDQNEFTPLLLLGEQEQGLRFWHLMRVQRVCLRERQYIFCVSSVLDIPVPTVLRQDFQAEDRAEEAQNLAIIDALEVCLQELRRSIRSQSQREHNAICDTVWRSLVTFMKGKCGDYEGDHFVPLVGQRSKTTFQQEVKWSGMLAEVRSSLCRTWEVSERHDECIACAVSDPAAEDCPLVYISRQFEKLTGYQREWALGRNCRFLQPNNAARNAVFNKDECMRIQEFCKEPSAELLITLLVTECKDGYPFWDLLVLEHVEVRADQKSSAVGAAKRRYIFAVHTRLHHELHRLTEMLAMDAKSLFELKRLRKLIHEREGSLQSQNMCTFARDCVALWACSLPATFELPRLKFSSARGKCKSSIPIIGLEVNSRNMEQAMPPALQDGIRHFYLTLPPTANGEVWDVSMGELEVKLLSLRVAQVLSSLSSSYLHYLREAITFTLVTPSCLVKFVSEIVKSLSSQGYKMICWLLDLRGIDRKHVHVAKVIECWHFMAEIQRAGDVQHLGLLGAGREVYDVLLRTPGAAPVAVLGLDVFPGQSGPQVVDYHHFQKAESTQRHGEVAVLASNVFGPKNALLEMQVLKDEAYRRSIDVAILLMKWCSSQVSAMMVPLTAAGSGTVHSRCSRTPGDLCAASAAAEIPNHGSCAAGGAIMLGESVPKADADVHRSFIKAFNTMLNIPDLEDLIKNGPRAKPPQEEEWQQHRCSTEGWPLTAPRALRRAGTGTLQEQDARRGTAAGAGRTLPQLARGRTGDLEQPSALCHARSPTSDASTPQSTTSPKSARQLRKGHTFGAPSSSTASPPMHYSSEGSGASSARHSPAVPPVHYSSEGSTASTSRPSPGRASPTGLASKYSSDGSNISASRQLRTALEYSSEDSSASATIATHRHANPLVAAPPQWNSEGSSSAQRRRIPLQSRLLSTAARFTAPQQWPRAQRSGSSGARAVAREASHGDVDFSDRPRPSAQVEELCAPDASAGQIRGRPAQEIAPEDQDLDAITQDEIGRARVAADMFAQGMSLSHVSRWLGMGTREVHMLIARAQAAGG